MKGKVIGKKLNINIALLRIIACFGVVCLHSFGALNRSVDDWLSYSIWYSFCFAIPIFFATSGYFVLSKKSISYIYVLKKITGFLLIVFSWCLLDSCIGIAFGRKLTNPIKTLFLALFQMGSLPRLWFFGAMIVMYALSPVFCRLMKNRKQCIALVIILLGANALSHINLKYGHLRYILSGGGYWLNMISSSCLVGRYHTAWH